MEKDTAPKFGHEMGRFIEHNRLEVTEHADGVAKVRVALTIDSLNPLGRPHGGLLFSMADTAAGTAAADLGYVMVTADSSMTFIGSATADETLTATARCIRRGQKISFFEVEITDSKDKLIAKAMFTMTIPGSVKMLKSEGTY